MATIGLDKVYYANITEDALGNETYGVPAILAKGIKADINVNTVEGTLYADDGASEVVKEFKDGTLSLGIDELPKAVAVDILDIAVDSNGVAVSASNNSPKAVAVGFRSKKSNGKYRYLWLYKVKFSVPSENLQTKGDSITFSTPTLEGTISARHKVDGQGKNPWKADVTDGETGVPQSVITNWFNGVYEPVFSGSGHAVTANETEHGTITLPNPSTGIAAGATVNFTVEAASGYNIGTVSATAGGSPVQVTAGESGAYSFTMPNADVVISATFTE